MVKSTTKKKKVYKIILICSFLIVAIYVITVIYGLIKEPTNIFMVENGSLYLKDESVRVYYS